MNRRRRHVAAALLLAFPIVAAIRGAQPASSAAIDYPDLQMIVPTDPTIGPQIYHVGATKELRFTHITSNLGDGPLEIKPVYDSTTQTAVGWQNLYKRDSTGKWNLVTSVKIPGVFTWDPAHGHYHFPLASYGLYAVASDGSVGAPVVMSPKVGFCIAEDYWVNLELPGAPAAIFYDGNTCTDPNAIRGISVGWGDLYDWTDPGQSIDISTVSDGVYWFRSIVDPQSNFVEKDTTNNARDLKIQIAGDTVRVLNPLPNPSSGFTFDQSFLQDGTGAISTPTFTTPAGETLVAFVASDGLNTSAQTMTVSGAGLNWTLVRRSNAQNGTAEVWTAFAASQVTGAVTSTPTQPGLDQSLTVLTLGGAGGIGASAAASGASGAPAVTLTTTQSRSWVMGVGNDPDHPTFRAISPSQKMVHEWVDSRVQRSFWNQATSVPTPAAGTVVQLNDAYPAGDRWNFVAVELLPPPSVPDAPTNVSASPGDASATVSWTAPASGGSAITKYTVTPYIGSTAQAATDVTGSPPPTSTTITGLTNGTTYTFTVKATNAIGTGPASSPSGPVTLVAATYTVGIAGADGALWVLKTGSSGFSTRGGILLGAPAVISMPQSTGGAKPIYVATGNDHDLWVRSDTAGWQRLSTNSVYCVDNPAGVVASGTLFIACQGQDRTLWHGETVAPTDGSLPRVNGTAWQSLGGALAAGPAVAPISGTVTYFVLGTDRHVYSRTLASGYTGYSWTCVGHPALATWGPNSYFACHGTDGVLWYAANPGTGWGTIQPLGGALIDGPGVAATSSGPVFFVEGPDGSLWHRSLSSGWTADGGQLLYGASAAAP